MAGPADIIAAYLATQGAGTMPPYSDPAQALQGWPIYIRQMPDGAGVPDNAIAVYDTLGVKDGRQLRGGYTFTHEGIQIKVRGIDIYPHAVTQDKIRGIAAILDALLQAPITVDGDDYQIVAFSRGPPLTLGQDVNANRMRWLVTLNGTVSYRVLSS